jgi:hypothetical protein
MVDLAVIKRKFELLAPTMSERGRRLWAGAEADAIGYGGVAALSAATEMALSTVRKGRDEVRAGASPADVVRDRRAGGGRHRVEKKDPTIKQALEQLVDPTTRGDPESQLRWTCKSTRTLSRQLTADGHPVSPQKVGRLLHEFGYSLQGNSRVKEGIDHPDRNAQFEWINARAKDCLAKGIPVISVDAKKKELVGEYANRGREWQPKGKAVEVRTYDFPDLAMPKAIPYGVYDVAANTALVNVGVDHDTAHFAVRSVEKWWEQMGAIRYPAAKELFITADAGGSNSYRSRGWKNELQSLADRRGLILHISHFPPGTSKWNKIEHRLFSFITLNWRGRPLTTYETIVSLIASTTTTKGLTVLADLDRTQYPLNIKVKRHIWKALTTVGESFHGEWNYTIRPRTPAELSEQEHAPPTGNRYGGRAHWEALVKQQLESGLIPSRFCRQQNVPYYSFARWRRIITGQVRPRRRFPK